MRFVEIRDFFVAVYSSAVSLILNNNTQIILVVKELYSIDFIDTFPKTSFNIMPNLIILQFFSI
jgi:hypothetical protein